MVPRRSLRCAAGVGRAGRARLAGRGAFLRDDRGLELAVGFARRASSRPLKRPAQCRVGDGGVGRHAVSRGDGLADRGLRVGLGAAAWRARRLRGVAARCRGSRRSVAAAAGAVAPASEAVAAMAAAAIASGAVALSAAGVAAGASPARRLTGCDGGNGVGRHRGRAVLRRLGLIGRLRRRRRTMPASFSDFAHRLRRVGFFAAADFVLARCRLASALASASASSRALAAASRSLESLRSRLCRCGLVRRGACRAPVVGRRRAHRRSGAARRCALARSCGAIVGVAGGRIAVDQRRETVVSGGLVGIRPRGPRRRALKRYVCQYF